MSGFKSACDLYLDWSDFQTYVSVVIPGRVASKSPLQPSLVCPAIVCFFKVHIGSRLTSSFVYLKLFKGSPLLEGSSTSSIWCPSFHLLASHSVSLWTAHSVTLFSYNYSLPTFRPLFGIPFSDFTRFHPVFLYGIT